MKELVCEKFTMSLQVGLFSENPGERAIELGTMLDTALSYDAQLTDEEIREFIDCLEQIRIELLEAKLELDFLIQDELDAQRSPEVVNMQKKLETKSAKMIDVMQTKAINENKLKRNISEISERKEAAKETVSTAAQLGLSTSQQNKEKKNLNKLRALHKDELKKLDSMAKERKNTQARVANTGALLAEMRKDESKRDYEMMYMMAANILFVQAFSRDDQKKVMETIQRMAEAKARWEVVWHKRVALEQVLNEVRNRIAQLVVQQWK